MNRLIIDTDCNAKMLNANHRHQMMQKFDFELNRSLRRSFLSETNLDHISATYELYDYLQRHGKNMKSSHEQEIVKTRDSDYHKENKPKPAIKPREQRIKSTYDLQDLNEKFLQNDSNKNEVIDLTGYLIFVTTDGLQNVKVYG